MAAALTAALTALASCAVAAAAGSLAARGLLRSYDVHAYRSHQCAHGRALTQACGECRCAATWRVAFQVS